MSSATKVFFLVCVSLLMVTHVLIYWNQHLYYKADKIGETDLKIGVLEKARKLYPYNELIFYELGKAFYELGMNTLGEEGRSQVLFQESMFQLKRSLRVNPPFYFGHFYLARTLNDMSFDSPLFEKDAYQEYVKAADLAGENTQVFYEVGKVFFSKWNRLSPEEKDLTLLMLKKVFQGKHQERIASLFYVWEIDVRDYDVIEGIFPEDGQIYRDFAEFLGKRSLSLMERQKYLAKSEFLEFRRAQDMFGAGKRALYLNQFMEAQTYLRTCRDIFRKIHLYQNLSDLPDRIDPSEYGDLQKQVLLDLIKTYVDQGKKFKDVAPYLWEYLGKENGTSAIEELESYLKKKEILGDLSDKSLDDLDRFSFLLYLSFKKGRFRDNMRIGQDLLKNLARVPGDQSDQPAKILKIVGESFQKVDHIYDSNDFFLMALERDPYDLETLTKLRRNYERLNAVDNILDMDRRIEKIVSPREIEEQRTIQKGQIYRRDMVFDGREINLFVHFDSREEAWEPLITVFFNGRVVWEDYLEESVISIPLISKLGNNLLQVVPQNREVELEKITYE